MFNFYFFIIYQNLKEVINLEDLSLGTDIGENNVDRPFEDSCVYKCRVNGCWPEYKENNKEWSACDHGCMKGCEINVGLDT